jgi:tRNA threonylcarbamoyladenosine biosynthesis protein TsaB
MGPGRARTRAYPSRVHSARPALGLELSQQAGGVALRVAGGEATVERFDAGVKHERDVMPAIDRLFRRAGLKPRDLALVAVSIGPGGFTGLRVAVTTAKMLAFATGAAIVPVPSAFVVAESIDSTGPIGVALAAKGERVWFTRFRREREQWTIEGTPAQVGADHSPLEGLACMAGDGFVPTAWRDRCAALRVPIVEPTFDPVACLQVGERAFSRGETIDPASLVPLYGREPEAVTLWQARAASKTAR